MAISEPVNRTLEKIEKISLTDLGVTTELSIKLLTTFWESYSIAVVLLSFIFFLLILVSFSYLWHPLCFFTFFPYGTFLRKRRSHGAILVNPEFLKDISKKPSKKPQTNKCQKRKISREAKEEYCVQQKENQQFDPYEDIWQSEKDYNKKLKLSESDDHRQIPLVPVKTLSKTTLEIDRPLSLKSKLSEITINGKGDLTSVYSSKKYPIVDSIKQPTQETLTKPSFEIMKNSVVNGSEIKETNKKTEIKNSKKLDNLLPFSKSQLNSELTVPPDLISTDKNLMIINSTNDKSTISPKDSQKTVKNVNKVLPILSKIEKESSAKTLSKFNSEKKCDVDKNSKFSKPALNLTSKNAKDKSQKSLKESKKVSKSKDSNDAEKTVDIEKHLTNKDMKISFEQSTLKVSPEPPVSKTTLKIPPSSKNSQIQNLFLPSKQEESGKKSTLRTPNKSSEKSANSKNKQKSLRKESSKKTENQKAKRNPNSSVEKDESSEKK